MIGAAPITREDVRYARQRMAEGWSLRKVAIWIGCSAQALDLALWESLGL